MDFESLKKKLIMLFKYDEKVLSLGLNSLNEFIVYTNFKWYYFSSSEFLNFLGEVKKVHLKINESKIICKVDDFTFVLTFIEDLNTLLGGKKITILLDKKDDLKSFNYLLK